MKSTKTKSRYWFFLPTDITINPHGKPHQPLRIIFSEKFGNGKYFYALELLYVQ